MTFRLFLFADRDANRVASLEQIPGEARQERLSCSAWKLQAWKYDRRYLDDHPGTNYVAQVTRQIRLDWSSWKNSFAYF
jgi:hypothetical protein